METQEEDAKRNPSIGQSFFNCKLCDKKYKHRQSLQTHVKTLHGVIPGPALRAKNALCLEADCGQSFPTLKDLGNHLSSDHSMKFEITSQPFATIEDFQKWKKEEEVRTHSSFVKSSATKIRPRTTAIGINYVCTYYYCNRSGDYASKSTGKRKGRSSCKMGYKCTAYMKLTIDGESILLTYCSTHYGHAKVLRFRQLTRMERRTKHRQAKCTAIKRHHDNSISLSLDSVTQFDEENFAVRLKNNKTSFSVTVSTQKACGVKGQCEVKCSICQVCVHNSSCSCVYSRIHGVVCNHVHLVCRYMRRASVVETSSEVESAVNVLASEDVSDVVEVVTTVGKTCNASTSLKTEIGNLLEEIGSYVRDIDDEEVLLYAKEMLISASNVLRFHKSGAKLLFV